jgi:hypothetical protein
MFGSDEKRLVECQLVSGAEVSDFSRKIGGPAEAGSMAVLSTCIMHTSAVGEIGEEAELATKPKDKASARRHALTGPRPHF